MKRDSLIIDSMINQDQYKIQRIPTPNSVIENQLFSKTCRPGSLVKNSDMNNSSSIQVSTPNCSQNFNSMSFSQSLNCDNIKSFVNLKKTVSDIDINRSMQPAEKMQSKREKPIVGDYFMGIVPDSFVKSNNDVRSSLFERTNEIFHEKIGICESKVMEPEVTNNIEHGNNMNANKKIESGQIVEECTGQMFQILLEEILEEIVKNN
jgi:hypothetical protein